LTRARCWSTSSAAMAISFCSNEGGERRQGREGRGGSKRRLIS
jgi:hypothetical protein